MIITICASIGSQNLGDELILKNEIHLLEEKYSLFYSIPKEEISFRVFTYDIKNIFYKKKNVIYSEYFPIDIKNTANIKRNFINFINFVKTVIKSKVIVVGGGGIIYDNELQSVGNPLKQWVFRSKIFKLLKKKVVFFRVGINIKNPKNYYLVDKIFSCAHEISVRDQYSFNLLNKLEYGKILSQDRDPVFSDKIDFQKRVLSFTKKKSDLNYLKAYISSRKLESFPEIVENNNISFAGKRVGLSLRRLSIEGYEKKIMKVLEILVSQGAILFFIPHSFHKTDPLANDYTFLNELKHNVEKNTQKKCFITSSMEESYEIYKEAKIDINLAQRLHAIILSHVYEIDFVGISYSKKTDEVLKQLKKD